MSCPVKSAGLKSTPPSSNESCTPSWFDHAQDDARAVACAPHTLETVAMRPRWAQRNKLHAVGALRLQFPGAPGDAPRPYVCCTRLRRGIRPLVPDVT